mmetsp:Transcript_88187/g.122369  ORF Transcript_88187/g.122369 Transcript_88187/m.122369 type:complete len:267 (+) Transcript_88187:54-854(+)
MLREGRGEISGERRAARSRSGACGDGGLVRGDVVLLLVLRAEDELRVEDAEGVLGAAGGDDDGEVVLGAVDAAGDGVVDVSRSQVGLDAAEEGLLVLHDVEADHGDEGGLLGVVGPVALAARLEVEAAGVRALVVGQTGLGDGGDEAVRLRVGAGVDEGRGGVVPRGADEGARVRVVEAVEDLEVDLLLHRGGDRRRVEHLLAEVGELCRDLVGDAGDGGRDVGVVDDALPAGRPVLQEPFVVLVVLDLVQGDLVGVERVADQGGG